ncbi:MAG: MAPEG family protein, partial [Myxococcota bacterium]
ALLHVAYDSDQSLANLGALIFLGARILYVPAYLSNILGVRSVVWGVSWIGLGLMIGALFLQTY